MKKSISKSISALCIGMMLVVVDLTSCRHSISREEALAFLYEYMPLPDSVDYSRAFFEDNVELAFRARENMKWGSMVPDREFRHFVLPVRVNNENLDSSRAVFFRELAPRIKGLSMADAVLEVNHWCHEKVSYTPSDIRTSSPLTTIRTATGRCGEESTLLVAALRSVCIPARQVYTPRWAHTDDNHAWVEAWVDGKWHFLGACEPEPVLDLGWFNAPASRAMLMHTNVFGAYDGPENVMSRSDCYTEIDVTDGYAPTGTAVVKVISSDGVPVEGAMVEFKIYNYAEFYTVTSRTTDARGLVGMHAGLGDLVAWAYKDGAYGYAVCPMHEIADTVCISLAHHSGESYTDDLTIVPPVERVNIPQVSAEARALNDKRLRYEDSLRRETISQFHTQTAVLASSRGNYPEIEAFLACAEDKKGAEALLNVLAEKDLHDITCNILSDHLCNAVRREGVSESDYVNYVLNPRVANEMIVPYRAILRDSGNFESAGELAQWVKTNITTDGRRNPQGLRMSPTGVLTHRACDSYSKGIFLVAFMRSNGFPARIDPVTDNVEYMEADGKWVRFESAEDAGDSASVRGTDKAMGQLKLSFIPSSYILDPKYYSHFTVSRISGGRAVLLNYAEEDSWATTFKAGQTLEAGDYQIVSGTRLSSGSVLVHIETTPVLKGRPTVRPLVLPQESESLSVIGSLNSEALYLKEGDVEMTSILSTTGRGYFVLGILKPGTEPTVHALKDLEKCARTLEGRGVKILLLTSDAASASKLRKEDYPGLPSNVVFGVDASGAIEAQIRSELHLRHSPVFVIADTFNRIVYASEGYTIGMGEKLAAALSKTAPGYMPTSENLASRAEFAGMKLGIFLHWGIYSMFGQGEWYMQNAGIDWREYEKAARGFYPAYFNAREWVEAIKASGARYITFTSRHHDSFSMFKTAQSDFNIVDATPFGRDVVAELADECHRQGVRLHLYYSHADWRREDYPMGRTGLNTGRDPSRQDWNSYLAFMKAQLTELLTNYGEIGAIWFDGVWDHDEDKTPFDWCLDEQYALIHSLQPACLVGNNHHMNVNPGEDIQIFERDVPGENKAGYSGDMSISKLPLETCQTMNGMWGYKVTDQNYKSVDELVSLLVATAGKGANLLLNIGPQPSGELPAAALERLRGLGEWTSKYGESIYGTTAGPVRGDWGVSTAKGSAIYLHVLDKNLRTLTLPLSACEAYCLTTDSVVEISVSRDSVTLVLPDSDEVDRVIRILA